jgi:hypothetical protein
MTGAHTKAESTAIKFGEELVRVADERFRYHRALEHTLSMVGFNPTEVIEMCGYAKTQNIMLFLEKLQTRQIMKD